MAFLVALLVRSGRGKKLTFSAICLLELAIILKTVSREGLLLALIVVSLAVLHVSFSNKIKIAMASILVCLFAAATLPRQSLDRYLTVFTHNVSGDAVASAEASSRARKQKLQESVQLTVRHPIFGVGMGVFMPASVDLAKENRMQPDWEVSHNSYTQVSSELGLPGLLILLAIFYTGFRQILQLSHAAKRAGHDDVRKLAVTLLIALVVLSVHFCFDSIAYVFYLPLVAGLVAAFSLNYAPITLETLPAEPPLRPVRPAILEPVPPGPWRQPPSRTTPKQSKVVGSRNPYRFGRRRRATLETEPEA
jgi:O-antigen ligase